MLGYRRAPALLAVAAVALLGLAGGGASATHCESNIYVFTRYTAPNEVRNPATGAQVGNPSVASTAIGCDYAGDVDGDGHEEDTRIISPGSNSFSIRWLAGEEPTSGTLTFAGKTYDLTFVKSPGVGGLSQYWNTPSWTYFDQTSSINGGALVATICVAELCETTKYRTIA